MADEEISAGAPVEVADNETKSPVTTDLKRKLNDLEPEEADLKSSAPADLPKEELATQSSDEVQNSAPDAKKPRLEEESDGSALENGHEVQKTDAPVVENAGDTAPADVEGEKDQNTNPENIEEDDPKIAPAVGVDTGSLQQSTEDNAETVNAENLSAEVPEVQDGQKSSEEPVKTEDGQHPLEGDLQQPGNDTQSVTRRMDVPNNKVGVLIGKAGDTIRFLQLNSGAKIQITRDAEADPQAPTRPVELIGTLENINKAERLIKDVIAEADAGGSPSLVARGFGTVQASGAADQIEIQVPNEKVGLIIGKGGETIKNLQTRSGARIQLIPQHLPQGDQSKERTVRVTGDKKQIELARDMIKEVMSQPVRSSQSGGYNQQGYRPRGPSGQPQWGARGHSNAQATGYDNQQRGMYQSQNSQYGTQAYGGYPSQQTAPRSNFNAGWDQRPGHMQTTPPQSGYDYYGHGGHAADPSAPSQMANPGPVPASAHGAPPTHVNYNNYGQQQGTDYGQPTYAQPAPQQNYSHGYDDPKYANQTAQPAYGGPGNAQSAAYPQQVAAQPGYTQQPYSKPPPYGMPPQGPAQAYGAPRASQPGDVPYQNPNYGQTVPSQQPYPYASGGPAQQAYPYNSAQPGNDAYNQPLTHSAPGPVYPQPGAQSVPGYAQPVGQLAPGYAQGQPGGYGAYPSQPGYGEQPVPNNAAYGYQGPEAGYGTVPTSAYGAPPSAQPNYAQPTSNQPTYEQVAPQSGAYTNVPGNAPGYVKNLSPQPVYGQYDSTQMYGGQH